MVGQGQLNLSENYNKFNKQIMKAPEQSINVKKQKDTKKHQKAKSFLCLVKDLRRLDVANVLRTNTKNIQWDDPAIEHQISLEKIW